MFPLYSAPFLVHYFYHPRGFGVAPQRKRAFIKRHTRTDQSKSSPIKSRPFGYPRRRALSSWNPVRFREKKKKRRARARVCVNVTLETSGKKVSK